MHDILIIFYIIGKPVINTIYVFSFVHWNQPLSCCRSLNGVLCQLVLLTVIAPPKAWRVLEGPASVPCTPSPYAYNLIISVLYGSCKRPPCKGLRTVVNIILTNS